MKNEKMRKIGKLEILHCDEHPCRNQAVPSNKNIR
jgi:hypothetical protein